MEVQRPMAIFHCHAQMISRSQRRSAVAAAAYRAGDTLTNERDGKTHDYSRKQNIAYTEIMAPDNAPAWVYDRGRLWNAAEAAENRRNSQTAREYEIALPNELSREQQIELCQKIGSQFVADGMIADMSLHAKEGNTHVHMMFPTREISQDGFTKKNRGWNERSYLADKRKNIANAINAALEKAGIDERVTDESFEKQGIDKIPTIHEGYAAREIEKRGKVADRCQKNREIKEENARLDKIEEEIAALEAKGPKYPWVKSADEEEITSILSSINNEITDDMAIEEADEIEAVLYEMKYSLYDDKALEQYAMEEAGLDPATPEIARKELEKEQKANEEQHQKERLPLADEVKNAEKRLQEARKALHDVETAEEKRSQSLWKILTTSTKADRAKAEKAIKNAETKYNTAKSALLDSDQKHQKKQTALTAKIDGLMKQHQKNREAVAERCDAIARKTVPGFDLAEKILARLDEVRKVIYNRRKMEKAKQKMPRTRRSGKGRG